METLLDVMLREAWRSSRLTSVRCHPALSLAVLAHSFLLLTEMLTPVDQPLDKLEDLQADEMYVYPLHPYPFSSLLTSILVFDSENMKGWIDHFSNKYIICGKLVENGQA